MNRMLKNPIKCGICESKIEKVSDKCHIKLKRGYSHSVDYDYTICKRCFARIANFIYSIEMEDQK